MPRRPTPPKEVNMLKLAKTLELAWREVNWPMFRIQSWNGKFTKPVTKNWKISLCTTTRNRAKDLRITLPANISSNLSYPNVEFVILDYNSDQDEGDWIKKEMMEHIESGKLIYLRTEEPKFFDMPHAKNIISLAATGDIINSIDADTFAKNNFAEFINKLANEQPEKAIFAKSRQLLRGRLGFWKKEFINLGGYSEILTGYGQEDGDLMYRSWMLGFKLMPFSRQGDFEEKIPDHHKHQGKNYKEPWYVTEARNRFISYTNLILKRYKANVGREWGKAKLVKNFQEEIETGIQG